MDMEQPMKIERFVRTGDSVEPLNGAMTTDRILVEIGRLYRDRFQALQHKDQLLMELLTQQIDELRARLDRL